MIIFDHNLKSGFSLLIFLFLLMSCMGDENPVCIQNQDFLQGVLVSDATRSPITGVQICYKNVTTLSDSTGHFIIPVPNSRVDINNDYIFFQSFPYTDKKVAVFKFLKKSDSDTVFLQLSAKLTEYERLLVTGLQRGYRFIPLVDWYRNYSSLKTQKIIVMRHDVDWDAETARAMASIEHRLNCHSTFYFRWSSAQGDVISLMRNFGDEVGLHYETLARYCVEQKITCQKDITPEVLDECRTMLKSEILSFEEKYGNIDSICSHGARRNRVIGISNDILVQGKNRADFFILFDANDAEIQKRVALFISDSWAAWTPLSLQDAMDKNYQTICALTHSNWWGDQFALYDGY
jgi:hypothetical protein